MTLYEHIKYKKEWKLYHIIISKYKIELSRFLTSHK